MKNLPDINKIASDGFALSERKDFSYALSDKKEMQDSIVLLSLRMALRSYFSTYHTMKAHIRAMEGKVIGVIDPQGYMDYLHFRDYWEAYAETVIHFHHFIELALKDLLRAEHPLLAIDPSAKPVILHRLLQRESLTLMEQEGLRSIEFAEALRRVCELIQAGRIDNHEKLDFIAKARVLLETLNSLRNRTIHRGSFILRYRALDNLIGGYVLPLVKQIMELPQYADAHKAWKYSELECKVDPLEEIVKEFEGGNYNLGKIAFLKELGRAAYQNPLSSGPVRRQREKKEIVILGQAEIRAEGIAKAELQDPPSHAVEVRVCPVCGANSLVVFQHTLSGDEFMDMVLDYSPDEPIAVEIGQKDVYAVECVCCSFNVDSQLKNPREYGLPIEDYWRTEYPSR